MAEPMVTRMYMELYAGIVGNMRQLDTLTKADVPEFNRARGVIFDQLLELMWLYPAEHDRLEMSPVHFKPTALMDYVYNCGRAEYNNLSKNEEPISWYKH